MREQLSKKYISGSGIEVGGLHFPLPVNSGVTVKYVDFKPLEQLKAENPHLDVKDLDIAVVEDASLLPFSIESQDFIIANHVLEHCENMIHTVFEWAMILKKGGVAFVAVPNKDHTFDRNRAVTPFGHYIQEEMLSAEENQEAHYRDWYANSTLEGHSGEALEAKVKAAMESYANIHWHVFDYPAIEEIAKNLGNAFFSSYELHENGSEVIIIWKK